SCCENVVVTQRGLPGPVRSNPAGAGHGSVFVRDGRGYPRPMVNTAWMETTDLAAGRGAVGIGLAVGLVVVGVLIAAFGLGSRSGGGQADLAAGRGAVGSGLAVGVVVVGVLIAAFALGSRRVRRGDTARPRPEEQPRMPEGGPVRETREQREPNEMPRSDRRL